MPVPYVSSRIAARILSRMLLETLLEILSPIFISFYIVGGSLTLPSSTGSLSYNSLQHSSLQSNLGTGAGAGTWARIGAGIGAGPGTGAGTGGSTGAGLGAYQVAVAGAGGLPRTPSTPRVNPGNVGGQGSVGGLSSESSTVQGSMLAVSNQASPGGTQGGGVASAGHSLSPLASTGHVPVPPVAKVGYGNLGVGRLLSQRGALTALDSPA